MTKNLNLKLGGHNGFTLIEMLISITIFMIFLGIAAASYTSLVRANQSANGSQKIYREVRHVFDELAQEIRGGSIDYSCVGPLGSDSQCAGNQMGASQSILSILHDGGGSRTLYKYKDNTLLVKHQTAGVGSGAWMDRAGWQPFISETLELEDLSFRVFPLQNPYESANASNNDIQWQPTVTIELKTGGHNFRTTYTSRTYGKQNIYD